MCQDDNKVLGVVLRMYEHFTKGEAKMQKSALFRTMLLASGVVASLGPGIQPAEAEYIQTNLVSNIKDLATITDPLLINPWGISRSPTSPFWTSNQGTNTATLYAVTGSTNVTKETLKKAENATVGTTKTLIFHGLE